MFPSFFQLLVASWPMVPSSIFKASREASSLIPDLCSHHHCSFSSLTLPLSLIKTLVMALGPCRSSRLISHLKMLNLITPTKSPCHAQVLRIKMWTSLGFIILSTAWKFGCGSHWGHCSVYHMGIRTSLGGDDKIFQALCNERRLKYKISQPCSNVCQ